MLVQVKAPIPWLVQLSSKLESELSFLRAFLDKTELLVTDTHQCYTTLDQVSDRAPSLHVACDCHFLADSLTKHIPSSQFFAFLTWLTVLRRKQ